ncbi:MAG: T9SS type A sorting domain-containing protein [Flavobacteriales bacterium]|nr:T9SS type A sorting domain-containing protein [Flavobacteriales bacterium]
MRTSRSRSRSYKGQLLSGDQIVVYNGADETANVIYQGANGGNMAGFAVNSQNPENIITLRIRSNAAGSCDDGAALTPLKWDVGCGFVGISEGEGSGFNVYPNPTRDLITVGLGSDVSGDVLIRVMDISGRVVMEHPYVAKGGGNQTLDLKGLQSGQYLVQLNTTEWVRTQRVELTR